MRLIEIDVVEILSWVRDTLLSTLSIMGKEIKLMFEEYRGDNKILLESENIAREKVKDPDEEIKRRIKEHRDGRVVEWDAWYLSDGAKICRKHIESKKTELHEAIKRTKSALKSLKDSLINKK